jgi:hypothetical protein
MEHFDKGFLVTLSHEIGLKPKTSLTKQELLTPVNMTMFNAGGMASAQQMRMIRIISKKHNKAFPPSTLSSRLKASQWIGSLDNEAGREQSPEQEPH